MKNVIAVINKRTKIELGLIIAILSATSGIVAFAYKASATIEIHSSEISELKKKSDKIDEIAENVAYIKGRIDKQSRR